MLLYKHYTIPKRLNSLKSETCVVGIDLGTSRCCAAVIRLNGVTTVPLDNTGERLLPSYVSYDEENAIFGKTAVKRLRNFPKSIVFDSKRIIGRNLNDIEIDSNWPFRISENNGKIVLEIKRFNDGTTITAEEIATDLLKYIKEKAEEFQGTLLNNVVITVPAAFTEAQKETTVRATKLAGFGNVNILPEPIAAAFAYFIDRHIPDNAKVLLFDLGGGTLDVCIFKIQNDEIHIISNIGDTKLGGRDFDTVLFNHFKHQLDTKYHITLSKDKKYKLILDCQQIKEDLSPTTSSILNVDEYDPNRHEIIPIKREEFENLTKPLLNRIRNTLFSAVHDSKLKENEINKLLLVGGGSRMPMIKRLLKEMFPLAEHICEEHPDEVVATGAAYYAHNISPEMTTYRNEKNAILENSLNNMCISTTYSIPRKHESYDTSINVIGIDFGASNCCAAVIRKKGIVTLPLDNYGETRIPSYISFDEEKAKFGKAAVDRLFSFAEYTVFDLKRLIGRSYDKKLIDATWPFEIVNDNNNIKIRYLNHLNQFTIKSPEELVSEFLRYIKERFFEYQGKKENPTTVITIPAGYNENQKQATLKAAKLAGFDKIYLLPEPVAATIAYAIDHPFPKNASILLFKLGHVTFEICILKVNNSQLQIISHTSDPNIGGRNFDIIIFEYFKKELYSRYEIDIQNDDEKYKHRQLSESRKIKHALDVRNEELIDVEDFNRNTEGIINITRKDFEAKSIQLIEKMQKLVVQALNKAKLQSYQINQIYRVGGASRMQMVKDMLLRMFPDAVHCEEEYPGESVAIGAAHYSYQLAGSIAVQSPHFFRRFFY